MKDYYGILEIDKKVGPEEVKKAYRRQALKYHPDRNQGRADATEKFKDVAEAYAVLIDSEKRRQYDLARRSGFQQEGGGSQGFNYTQDEIFRDFFKNPKASQTFQDLGKEFERSGLRFDRVFFEKTFLGGRGYSGLIFGGVFFVGTLGVPWLRGPIGRLGLLAGNAVWPLLSAAVLKFVGSAVGTLLGGRKKELPEETTPQQVGGPLDVNYNLTIPRQKIATSTWVKIALPKEAGGEIIKVQIPAGIKSGLRLRLKGKGLAKGRDSGDLYVTVHLQ